MLPYEIIPSETEISIPITSSDAASIHGGRPDGEVPENAYDQKTSTIYAPRDGVEENWVRFNFGKMYNVTRIVVINRLDEMPEILNDTEVYVGNTVSKMRQLCGRVTVKDTTKTAEAQTYAMNCGNFIGDYAFLTDKNTEDTDKLSFSEISIFGHVFGG